VDGTICHTFNGVQFEIRYQHNDQRHAGVHPVRIPADGKSRIAVTIAEPSPRIRRRSLVTTYEGRMESAMNQRIMTASVLAVLMTAALAACHDAYGEQNPAPGAAGAGGAQAASPFTPPSSPQESASARPAACGAKLHLSVDTAAMPAPICVHVGQVLQLNSGPSPHQPWEEVVSSDPDVVSCTSTRAPDGAIVAGCHALKPGTVTLSTGTMPFAGDPHGPAQHAWQVAITVVD
jgi:hypothetical protein